MRIIICGSISAAIEIVRVRDALVARGHTVEIPEGVKSDALRGRTDVSESEKVGDKIAGDLIRGYYEKIKGYDAVLVVNPERRGMPGYIGGNTFLEMGFAHVLGKPLYCLYPLPEMPYRAEMLAMRPMILRDDLEGIETSSVIGQHGSDAIDAIDAIDADEYQRQAMRSAGDLASASLADGLIVSALGLTGEAGEVADLVKKHIAQGHPLDREKLLKEAGDVAWYLARLCATLEVSLSEVLRANIEKLWERYPDGFSAEASIERKD